MYKDNMKSHIIHEGHQNFKLSCLKTIDWHCYLYKLILYFALQTQNGKQLKRKVILNYQILSLSITNR